MNAISTDASPAMAIPSDALIPDAGSLLDALKARQAELELSNAAMDSMVGVADGYIDKMLGPARVKAPSLTMTFNLLEALAMSVVLVRDPAKVARMSPLWSTRDRSRVRDTLIGKTTLRKARPLILSALTRKAGQARWAGKSPEERRAAMAKVRAAKGKPA